ncbi:MAG: hypothetical protein HKM04_08180 [Legionellales bacterium]|nr:hypothetical protein [Legionellales bacterium]
MPITKKYEINTFEQPAAFKQNELSNLLSALLTISVNLTRFDTNIDNLAPFLSKWTEATVEKSDQLINWAVLQSLQHDIDQKLKATQEKLERELQSIIDLLLTEQYDEASELELLDRLGSVDNWFFEAKKERIEEKLVLV